MSNMLKVILFSSCFLLISAGKLTYDSNRSPSNGRRSYFWPNYDIVPSEGLEVFYPTWYSLPWKPIVQEQPWEDENEPSEPSPMKDETDTSRQLDETTEATTEVDDNVDDDEDAEGRRLFKKKPHKHEHKRKHQKHKHQKRKHHKHKHHGTSATDGEALFNSEEALLNPNTSHLQQLLLELEEKLAELRLHLFGMNVLKNVVEGESARYDIDDDGDEPDPESSGEKEPISIEEEVDEKPQEFPNAEADEGKILQQVVDGSSSELEAEHRRMEGNAFEEGRSLMDDVHRWFEGLDLTKIAELPVGKSYDENVLKQIDVRSSFDVN